MIILMLLIFNKSLRKLGDELVYNDDRDESTFDSYIIFNRRTYDGFGKDG